MVGEFGGVGVCVPRKEVGGRGHYGRVTNFFTTHSLLINERIALLNDIQGINNSISELSDSHIVQVLLHGRKFLDISSNTNIVNATVEFLLKIKRFDERLFKVKINETMAFYIFIFKFNFFLYFTPGHTK